jgi:hypothetical protein
MNIYNLGKVASTTDGFGFNIIGVHGRPLVGFSFEDREDAEAVHNLMQAIVAKAKLITSYPR